MSNVILIAAVSENNVIGKNNDLPWKLKDDLRLFSNLTKHHVVVMGRKNYESIGKPLPNRVNVVLSRDPNYEAEGCIVMDDIRAALNLSNWEGGSTFVIGGADIYRLAMPYCTHFFRTVVHTRVEDGDVWFPKNNLVWDSYYECRYEKDIEGGNEHAFTFQMLKRRDES